MLFSEKLDQIMLQCNIKNIDLAKAMNVSPSFVSKIRRGLCIPSSNNETYEKLYHALSRLLSDSQIIELKQKYNLSWNQESFCTWVTEDCTKPLPRFSAALYKLMDFFGVSNHTLAKELNFAPSLISKYKTGNRIPSTDSKIVGQIADYFALLSFKQQKEKELLQTLGMANVHINKKEELSSILLSYLTSEELSAQIMDKILHMMQEYRSFIPDFKKVSELLKSTCLPPYPLIKKQGNEGLRQHVLLFLALCCKSEKKLELKLFSNQNMTWMIEDAEFFQTWRALMLTVLACGHKIIIVHNINRNDKELFSAIEGWLPLHLSGNIESYYSTDSSSKPFSNTIFNSGTFAIYGSSIDRLENETDFYFTQEKTIIQKLENAFVSLTKHSQKLLRAFHLKSLKDIDIFIPGLKNAAHGVHLMQQNLPVWCMDDALLTEILQENCLSTKESEYILQYVQKVRSLYENILKNSTFFEYFYIPKQRIYEKQAFDFLNIYEQKPIYYTQNQYKRHLKNIANALDTYENYHITLLNKPLHDSIKLFQFQDDSIFAIRNKFPVSAIQYESDILLSKFHDYIFAKQENALNSITDYEEIIRRLISP